MFTEEAIKQQTDQLNEVMLKIDPTAQNLEREDIPGGGSRGLTLLINKYSQKQLEGVNEPQITNLAEYAAQHGFELEEEDTYIDQFYGKVYGKEQKVNLQNDIHQYEGLKIDFPKLSPTASRQANFIEDNPVFEGLKDKKLSLIGQNSIINAEVNIHNVFLAKKQTKEIYKDMSRAELEIVTRKIRQKSKFEFTKDQMMNKKSKKKATRASQESEDSCADDIEGYSDHELEPYDESKQISGMYRSIIEENPNEDSKKTEYQIMREIFDHTENKMDVNRNMLASVYVTDPSKFKDSNEAVIKVQKNNLAWPGGYMPGEYKIQRAPVTKTKEEKFLEEIHLKHNVKMAPLNKFYIDDAIQNLKQVCGTQNAIGTYKQHGWKASFAKYKNAGIKAQMRAEQELRDKVQSELPVKLRNQVSLARFGSTYVPESEKKGKKTNFFKNNRGMDLNSVANSSMMEMGNNSGVNNRADQDPGLNFRNQSELSIQYNSGLGYSPSRMSDIQPGRESGMVNIANPGLKSKPPMIFGQTVAGGLTLDASSAMDLNEETGFNPRDTSGYDDNFGGHSNMQQTQPTTFSFGKKSFKNIMLGHLPSTSRNNQMGLSQHQMELELQKLTQYQNMIPGSTRRDQPSPLDHVFKTIGHDKSKNHNRSRSELYNTILNYFDEQKNREQLMNMEHLDIDSQSLQSARKPNLQNREHAGIASKKFSLPQVKLKLNLQVNENSREDGSPDQSGPSPTMTPNIHDQNGQNFIPQRKQGYSTMRKNLMDRIQSKANLADQIKHTYGRGGSKFGTLNVTSKIEAKPFEKRSKSVIRAPVPTEKRTNKQFLKHTPSVKDMDIKKLIGKFPVKETAETKEAGNATKDKAQSIINQINTELTKGHTKKCKNYIDMALMAEDFNITQTLATSDILKELENQDQKGLKKAFNFRLVDMLEIQEQAWETTAEYRNGNNDPAKFLHSKLEKGQYRRFVKKRTNKNEHF